ncbi:cysteinyl-tRNA synthetase [Crinalium epipsammum PCC 9333]|uniref:Cysteine--tRNA ligase n=1 Tax=Crinalium epipsammum PCC 9333 TaxID=1173022 RepID=K9VXE7_9CYAN|nr:cysteine--tRNA ligase [Crinalium epipsammum]AFZ12788.1 cysteinyl-tRNA synthetase [Crinalium epipsammum PCC 9333]
MTLNLYNTLTRSKEPFEPLEPGKVQMYYCGVTVYDYCHLGHARACIVWDAVRRYLQWRGYDVRFVQNFTDIDDKILNRAREENSSMEEVAERYIQAYFEDMKRLNVKDADEYPRATHTLDGIKRLIHDLENKGFAYPAEGDVYYAVRKFPEYGKLSGRKLEDLQAGASGRVEVEEEDTKKQDPFDFALWKGAKEGEPAWESNWGSGRPGWHIECSAMVRDRLGETIDIHAGGADLIFPHHENEIAQSEAVTGKPLATFWLHNGMVTVNGEKMSKSLGNFITIRELLERQTDPMAMRLFVLTAQYRKPIDFSEDAIAGATNGWNTLKEGLLFCYQHGSKLGWTEADLTNPTKVEPVETEVNQASEPKPESNKSVWQETLIQILQPFLKLPQAYGETVKQYKELVFLTIAVALGGVSLKFASEVLKIASSVPFLPPIFEIIGIGITGRYLFKTSTREMLVQQVRSLIQTVDSKINASEEIVSEAATQEQEVVNEEAENYITPNYVERFQTALDDDFNFAEGLAVLFEIAKHLRKEGNLLVHQGKTETNPEILKQQWYTLVGLAQILGLEAQPDEDNTNANGLTDAEIEALVEQRQEARNAKDFAEADRIRDELEAQGIIVSDGKAGGKTRWHRS